MTARHARSITLVAVLVALAAGVQAQTPEIDALRARAEQGHADAQYNLGVRYRTGQGVPQHYAEAVRWYRLAADQGVAWAQTYLGNMYETGEGVPPSYVQAHMWHNLVASRTSGEQRDSAVEARDRVAGLMIPTQIAEAQRLAREWDAAHPR